MQLPLEFGEKYRLEMAEERHYEDIRRLMMSEFIFNLPHCRQVPAMTGNEAFRARRGDTSLRDVKEQKLSLVAIDTTTGRVIGVMVNAVKRKYSPLRFDGLEEFARFCGVDLRIISFFELFQTMELKADIFNRFNVDIVFELKQVVVESAYNGHGIASKMVEASIQLAVEHGYRLVRGIWSGEKAQAVARKNGLRPVLEGSLLGIKDKLGDPVYHEAAQDVTFQFMIREI